MSSEVEETRDQTAADGHTTAAADTTRLRALLRDLTVAANRMRDGWAEGDDAYKNQLWRALHEAADAASEEVYPL